MNIKKDISLLQYNTFKIDVIAKEFDEVSNIEYLYELFNQKIFSKKFLILGGGSNILFTKDYDGIILKMNIKERRILKETDNYIKLKLGAGEILEEVVEWSVKSNSCGIQNLALIPGTIGATPIQNVGAYGVEIKDVLESVEYFDTNIGKLKTISNTNCKFAYRDSIFKHELKGKAIVTSITINLEKPLNGIIPQKYITYGDITKQLESKYSEPYTIENLYNVVCDIRRTKLPDVKEYGSCGSTFQNPIVTKTKYEKIKKKYSEIPSFPTEDSDRVKIPAAYILERLGWKNKRIGDCGTWSHPLIVTNYGNATTKEVLNVIAQIQEDFFNDIGVKLETEINII